ncbi:hypothetical protein ACA910_005849 [Epithemia clementina (nom. ined.)]
MTGHGGGTLWHLLACYLVAQWFIPGEFLSTILIADSGCNQMLVTLIWTILHHTGQSMVMTGAFAGRNSGQHFPVVTAAAKLIDESGKQYAVVAHKVLYNSSLHQVDSLLSIHQSLSYWVNGINDWAHCKLDVDGNPGKQKMRFNDKELIFHFDGVKCFFEVAAITQLELSSLP